MEYEVIKDQMMYGWRVEAINHEGDGEAYVAIFFGPVAESRARAYAAWKNTQFLAHLGFGDGTWVKS